MKDLIKMKKPISLLHMWFDFWITLHNLKLFLMFICASCMLLILVNNKVTNNLSSNLKLKIGKNVSQTTLKNGNSSLTDSIKEDISTSKEDLRKSFKRSNYIHQSFKSSDGNSSVNEINAIDLNRTRKDSCVQCFKHDFKYLINNAGICRRMSTTHSVVVIVFIMTVHRNVAVRQAIRNTWLTPAKFNMGVVRYAFLLGGTKSIALQTAVVRENNVYHDIIQEDFIDSYGNLTLKTMMAFQWATTYCAHAQFVMKTDDDVFVNIDNLLRLVKDDKESFREGIVGSCKDLAMPIRRKTLKGYASWASYPHETYPGFCSGTGYVTSMSVAKSIYQISPNVPFFHLEDVYVSLCINALGMKLTNSTGFIRFKVPLNPCLLKGNTIITSHRVSIRELYYIWKAKCKT